MLQQFIAELNWPDEVLASHLMKRLKLMASDMVQSCVKRYVLKKLQLSTYCHFIVYSRKVLAEAMHRLKTFRNQARENLALVAKRGKNLPRVQDTKRGKDGLCQICKLTNLRTWGPFLPEKLLFLHSRSRSPLSKLAGNITVNKRRLTGLFAETRGYYL